MAQTKKKNKNAPARKPGRPRGSAQKTPAKPARPSHSREIGAVIFFLLGIFAVIGYFAGQGVLIAVFSELLKGLLGWGYYVTPPLLFFCAAILTFHKDRPVRFRVISVLMLSVVISALAHLILNKEPYTISLKMIGGLWTTGLAATSGGAVGGTLSEILTYLLGRAGTVAVFVCAAVFFLLAALNKTIADIAETARERRRIRQEESENREVPPLYAPPAQNRGHSRDIDIPLDDAPAEAAAETPKSRKRMPLFDSKPRVKTPDEVLADVSGKAPEKPKEYITPADVPLDIPFMEDKKHKAAEVQPIKSETATEKAQKITVPEPPKPEASKTEPPKSDAPKSSYDYPPLDLLACSPATGKVDGTDEIRLNIERLEAAFRSFGVNVKISGYMRGPAVTRYEAELEAGVKLNRLTSLADDIALSLGASGVRIAAMPNKISTVGIEVPNKNVSKVFLRDIIDTQEFKNAASKLTFAVGKNISGEAVVGDIAKLTHMLVAGTTGSGKSVCLNSLILSILYKSTPEEVRFIMIDPKMVEFRVYNGIPHLLVPVVTDVKKASSALQWAVFEMMKRYKLFSESNARDLASYNAVAEKTEELEKLPQIVIVIDELADLMMIAAKEVEESVCRIAQMGRAAGIHLVIATQSPRADVITGLMKANIPSRIALKVSSSLESRIILDAGGNADKLVGNGDMLFAPIGSSKPTRIQGTWVSDAEREEVVAFVKKRGDAQYNEEVINQIDKAAEEKSSDGKKEQQEAAAEYDELLVAAVEVIFETGQASVSMLQRRLKLGYSRAARIVDQMEQLGIVGPFEGSKPRQLLITRQQWHEMQFLHGTAPIGTLPDEQLTVEENEEDEPEEKEDAPF